MSLAGYSDKCGLSPEKWDLPQYFSVKHFLPLVVFGSSLGIWWQWKECQVRWRSIYSNQSNANAQVLLLHTSPGHSVCYVTNYLFSSNYAINSDTV